MGNPVCSQKTCIHIISFLWRLEHSVKNFKIVLIICKTWVDLCFIHKLDRNMGDWWFLPLASSFELWSNQALPNSHIRPHNTVMVRSYQINESEITNLEDYTDWIFYPSFCHIWERKSWSSLVDIQFQEQAFSLTYGRFES